MRINRFDDRQVAALVIGLLLIIAPFVLIGVPLLVVSGWMSIMGLHPHARLWGWVSTQTPAVDPGTKQHYTAWDVANWVMAYPLIIVTLYLLYQFCELLWFCFSEFHKALSQPLKNKY